MSDLKSIKTKPWNSPSLKSWLTNHMELMQQLPRNRLLNYTSVRPNELRSLGESLVEHFIYLGPICSTIFDTIISAEKQKAILETAFKAMAAIHVVEGTGLGSKDKSGFYRTTRNFSRIVPEAYKRSEKAPRLTAITPNGLHGMKKDFQILNLEIFTKLYPQYFVLEVDLSACHTRIASSLMPEGNPLEEALEKGEDFWDQETKTYLPWFQEVNPLADFDRVKDIFKIFLYTSLNGGSPSSTPRVESVMTGKAKSLVTDENKPFMEKVLKEVATVWPLTAAVKGLNKECYCVSDINPEEVLVHCIDTDKPYVLIKNKCYCGISRVLQSFEVVMLSLLVGYCIELDLIMISGDHDGAYVLGRIDETLPHNPDIKVIMEEYENVLSAKMADWTTFLLRKPMPVVVKRMFLHGKAVKK